MQKDMSKMASKGVGTYQGSKPCNLMAERVSVENL